MRTRARRCTRSCPSALSARLAAQVLALLLEREDAIATWRALLGPGDPAVARESAPLSIRARFGTNKQANAAHGADSLRAVFRSLVRSRDGGVSL